MLPDTEGFPPCSAEMLVCVTISALVRFDLRQPPFPIARRGDEMGRAAMPEASIHEHCDAMLGKGDVDATPRQTRDRILDAKSAPSTMQLPAESSLWMGPFTALPSEALADRWVSGRGRLSRKRRGGGSGSVWAALHTASLAAANPV